MQAVWIIVICSLISGCGSSSSGSGTAAPMPAPPVSGEFTIAFPGANAATEASAITITGTTTGNNVSAVRISTEAGATEARQRADGVWQADAVALRAGLNRITAELTLADGSNASLNAGTITSNALLGGPTAIAFDANADELLITDGARVLGFDATTGGLRVVSGPAAGTGRDLQLPTDIELIGGNAAAVFDQSGIVQVDLATGDRTTLVDVSITGNLNAISYDNIRNRLLAISFLDERLLSFDLDVSPPTPSELRPGEGFNGPISAAIDAVIVPALERLVTPSTTVFGELPGFDINNGVNISIPYTPSIAFINGSGIAFDSDTQQLFLGTTDGFVFSIDPFNADTRMITTGASLPGINLRTRSLALANNNAWSVSPGTAQIIAVDLTSGTRRVAKSSQVGSGNTGDTFRLGRFDESNQRLIAVSTQGVLSLDTATGVGTRFVDFFQLRQKLAPGDPFFLFAVGGMHIDRSSQRLWLLDQRSSLVEINLADIDSGELDRGRLIAGPQQAPNQFPQFTGLTIDAAASNAYTARVFPSELARIDLATGERTTLASLESELIGQQVTALLLDDDNNRLILLTAPVLPIAPTAARLFSFSLTDQSLSLIASLDSIDIQGPAFPLNFAPRGTQLAFGADNNEIWVPVPNNPTAPFIRVNLQTGALIPSPALADTPLLTPNAIDVTDAGRVFMVDGSSGIYTINAATGERALIFK